MTAQSNIFPAFIRAEYDASSGGFPAFERAASQSFGQVEGKARQFAASFDEIGRVIAKSLTGGLTSGGGLDLNVGQFRQAAAEARAYEQSLRLMQTAASELATRVGDTSQATRTYIQALSAQAIEAGSATRAAEAQVTTYSRLQQELDGMTSKNGALAQSYRELFAEQVKAAQQEVAARRSQENINSLAAPGLTRSASSGGAGYTALAAEMDRAEQAARQYQIALAELKAQVDPASIAQARFAQESAVASEAMKRGDITAAQYASRMAFLSAEMGRNATSTRQTRFASVQLGQQLQDVVIQAQMGTNAFVILAQQGSQAAYALTGMGGAVGRLASFMAGWQGAIVLAAVALAGPLVSSLMSASRAAGETADALGKVKFSSSDLSNAQSILGTVMDTATGKMKVQREELIALGIAQAKVAALMASARAQAARGAVQDLQNPTTEFSGGIGGGFSIRRRSAGSLGVLSQQILSGDLDAKTAVDQLSSLQKAGRLTAEEFATAAASVTALGIELQNVKINEATERMLKGLGTKEDKALLLTPRKAKKDNSANAAAVLAERGEDAAKKIANISDRFADIPPQVQAVNAAMRELDDLADDFARKKPPNYGEIVVAIEAARKAVQEGLVKPYNDLIKSQEQHLEIGKMIASGRTVEAEAVQTIYNIEKQMGPIGDRRREQIIANLDAMRQQSREMEKQRRAQQNLLSLVEETRQNVKDTVYSLLRGGGIKSFGDFFKNLFDSYLRALSEQITESLLGDLFQKQTDRIKGETRLSDAGMRMASSMDVVKSALDNLANAVNQTATEISGTPPSAAGNVLSGVTTPANDNGITVTAPQTIDQTMRRMFKDLGAAVFGEDRAKKFGQIISTAMQGAGIGMMAGGLVLGGNNSKAGSAIGGALGKIAGEAIGKKIGGTLGKALGPLGAIAGGLLGGALGGLLAKPKYGSATIGGVNGQLSITGTQGNSASRIAASTKSADAVIGSIESIAEQFGAGIDASLGKVTIGKYKDKWRVSTTGYEGKLNFKGNTGPTGKGLKDFGDDAQAAAEYATLDLIKDGVIRGLRAGTQTLLQNAKGLQDGLAKALKFENVFRDLKRFKDPVGAAIDDLNREFQSLVSVFQQAGATAQETAQLEELYGIKRKAAVEDAFKSLSGSLKDLLTNLTTGDSGYSLRTRLTNARAAYDPLAARVQAGDTTAYDDFANAAQTLVDLQRQYSGSQQDYFSVLDQVTALTRGELGRQQAAYANASTAGTPFDTTPIVSAVDTQTDRLASAIVAQTQAANDNNTKLIAAMQAALGSRVPIQNYFAAIRNF